MSLYILWRSTPTLASLLRESEISLWASKKTLRLAQLGNQIFHWSYILQNNLICSDESDCKRDKEINNLILVCCPVYLSVKHI